MTLKKISYPLLIAVLLLFTGCEESNAQGEENTNISESLEAVTKSFDENAKSELVKIIKKQCVQLTKDAGKEHQAVVGKLQVTNSNSRVVIAGGDTHYTYSLNFANGDKKTQVLYPFSLGLKRQGLKKAQQLLEQNNLKIDQVSASEYGICYWVNETGVFIADLENLKYTEDIE